MESSDEALLNVQGLLLYNVTDDVQCGYVDLLESVRMEFNLPPYFVWHAFQKSFIFDDTKIAAKHRLISSIYVHTTFH